MSLSPINSIGVASPPVFGALPLASGKAPAVKAAPDEVGRAAQQFEAILVRQLLTPAIEPMMNGTSLGGDSAGGGGGGGVYSYMLTDVLATAMSQGGGLGLASVLKRQMTPTAATPAAATPAPATPTAATPSSVVRSGVATTSPASSPAAKLP